MTILFTCLFCPSLSQRYLYFVNLTVLFFCFCFFVFIVFFPLIKWQLQSLMYIFLSFMYHLITCYPLNNITILIVLFVHCSCSTVYVMSSNLSTYVGVLFVQVCWTTQLSPHLLHFCLYLVYARIGKML